MKSAKEIAEIILPPTKYERPDDKGNRLLIKSAIIRAEQAVWKRAGEIARALEGGSSNCLPDCHCNCALEIAEALKKESEIGEKP